MIFSLYRLLGTAYTMKHFSDEDENLAKRQGISESFKALGCVFKDLTTMRER